MCCSSPCGCRARCSAERAISCRRRSRDREWPSLSSSPDEAADWPRSPACPDRPPAPARRLLCSNPPTGAPGASRLAGNSRRRSQLHLLLLKLHLLQLLHLLLLLLLLLLPDAAAAWA